MISDKSITRQKDKRPVSKNKPLSNARLTASIFNRVVEVGASVCNGMEYPIYASLLIEIDNGSMCVTAQDTNIYFVGKVNLLNGGNAKPYQVLINGALCARVASKLVGMGELEIGLTQDNFVINGTTGFKCELAPLYEGYGIANEYPGVHGITKLESSFIVNTTLFAAHLEYVVKSASNDAKRGLLNGVKLEVLGGVVKFSATNGIQTASSSYLEPKTSDVCIVLPLTFVRLLLASVTDKSILELHHGESDYDREIIEVDITESGLKLKIGTPVTSGAAFPSLDKIRTECKPSSSKLPNFAKVEINVLADVFASRLICNSRSNLFVECASYVGNNYLALHSGDPDTNLASALVEVHSLRGGVGANNVDVVCVAASKVAQAIAALSKLCTSSKIQIWYGAVLFVLVIDDSWFGIACKSISGQYSLPKVQLGKEEKTSVAEGLLAQQENFPDVEVEVEAVETVDSPEVENVANVSRRNPKIGKIGQPSNHYLVDNEDGSNQGCPIFPDSDPRDELAPPSADIETSTEEIAIESPKCETEMFVPETIDSVLFEAPVQKSDSFVSVTPAFLPTIQKYKDIKEEYANCILVMQIGDFYEALWDDARTLSNTVNLTLTTKKISKTGERAPLAGFPVHAKTRYVEMILDAGFAIAVASYSSDDEYEVRLCEPMDDF